MRAFQRGIKKFFVLTLSEKVWSLSFRDFETSWERSSQSPDLVQISKTFITALIQAGVAGFWKK